MKCYYLLSTILHAIRVNTNITPVYSMQYVFSPFFAIMTD